LAFLTFNGSTATPSSTRAASQASIKERTTCRTEIAHMTRMMDFQKLNGYKNVENHRKTQPCHHPQLFEVLHVLPPQAKKLKEYERT
jgi:hypothetical protein